MHKTSTLTISRKEIITATAFAILIGIATFAPVLHYQPITGPLVNATLFIAAAYLGPQTAILVGLFPSLIALSTGLLPAPLAPMIPFIMFGNAILIITATSLGSKNYWLKIAFASSLKFLFLFGTSFIVINFITETQIAQNVALLMSWPQLVTALAGGVIAYPVIKLLKK
jgi:hypothetical protein